VLSSSDRVYVGIDALDESQSRDQILALLEMLVTQTRFSKIQLFATSREYAEIKSKMQGIAQPLSMSNPFVEADIRHFVTAKIRDNARFQQWPQDLRSDVEHTLSTGAKGMFRWAVCQLDLIRRLYHQSKIRTAIRSLPETLDETYERIFSYITDQERDLVRHALHWVCFHSFLWDDEVPLPARVLLDSYAISETAGKQSSTDDLIYDLDVLKEVSGCLITFSQRDHFSDEETVTIAHYTVREFLESNRAITQLAGWTKISTEECYSGILGAILDFATAPEAPPLCVEDYDVFGHGPLEIGSASSLHEYCLASSVRSLTTCEKLVNPSLAFRLLDPCAAHYKGLILALRMAEVFSRGEMIPEFWDFSWTDTSSKASSAVILISLLVMNCFGLAKALATKLDIKQLIHQNLTGELLWRIPERWFGEDARDIGCQFQGNIVDVLAQIRELDKDCLDFIQETAPTLVNYQKLLPSFVPCCGGPYHGPDRIGGDVLQRLLDLGADPDPTGFRVTPLQIATYTRDLEYVRILLNAGADPNNAGDPHGSAWNGDSVLSPFNRLHGNAPIELLRALEPQFFYLGRMTDEEIEAAEGVITDEIEWALLSYGATPPRPGWKWMRTVMEVMI
jgi:hypothetical protein